MLSDLLTVFRGGTELNGVLRPSGRHFLRRGSFRYRLSATIALGCVVAAAFPVQSEAASQPVVPTTAATAVAAPVVPTEAPDEASAVWLAYKHGVPVEVLSERTERSQTFAQPDGTLRARQFATPQRARRGGAWVSINTDLEFVGNVVMPKATTLDVRFSAGDPIPDPSGSTLVPAPERTPLVAVADGDASFSVTWPGTVPKPTLYKNTATYKDLIPGVDLELTAEADSFSKVLVVRTVQAAVSSALASLRLGLKSNGVTLEQDPESGFIRAVGTSGKTLFGSDGARMWDSPAAVPPGSPAPDEEVPRRTEDLAVKLTKDSITVVPSRAMLTDPAIRFPIYIDPGFNNGKEIWTHVSKANPNRSYWTDAYWRKQMRVGQRYDGPSGDDWRTLVQFDVSALKGAKIYSASVLVNVWHTGDCQLSPFQLWRTTKMSKSSAVTWNNTKGNWWKRLAEVKATANKRSCEKGNDEVRFGGKEQSAVRKEFQAVAKKGNSTITLAFRAKSESDKYQWKKLLPGSAYLDINYNHKPGKPTELGFSPCYKSCGSSAVTSTGRPYLTMKVTDPNDGTLRYFFEIRDKTQKTVKVSSGKTLTGITSGTKLKWPVPAKKDLADGDYFWRGRGCDKYVCGAWSGWRGFTVDTTNPKVPKVHSDLYQPTGWNGAPNTSGVFEISPSQPQDKVQSYVYSLNGGKAKTVTPGSGGVWKGSIAPPKDMVNLLKVSSIDTAGNDSGEAVYSFKVKPVGDSWYWGFDEGTGKTAASAPVNNRPTTITGSGVSWAERGLAFTGAGELTTQSPVVNTAATSGFTVAAWVKLPGTEPTDSPEGDEPIPTNDDEPAPGDPSGDDPESEETPPDTPEDDELGAAALPVHNQSAVSADGLRTSMFRLGYRTDVDLNGDKVLDPAWCFTVAGADTDKPVQIVACTRAYLDTGVWTHLVGVVDPGQQTIRLYVNGIPAKDGVLAEVPGTAKWEAPGKVAVGRGWATGAATERWVGEIDDVYAVPGVWSEREIQEKALEQDGEVVVLADQS